MEGHGEELRRAGEFRATPADATHARPLAKAGVIRLGVARPDLLRLDA